MRWVQVVIFTFFFALRALPARGETNAELSHLKRHLGRHLLVGFSGAKVDTSIRKMIREVHPGGVIIFARNIRSIDQLRTLTRQLQAESIRVNGRRLLVAIDQEGGNVVRIKHNPPLPSALAIGKTEQPEVAELAGQATGRLLKAVGINVNFAPVLDVTDPNADRFLGTRVYGRTSEEVAQMGVAFAKGLAQAGVLPIAKHFPGHGSVKQDTHLALTTSKRTLDELKATDLVPFRALAQKLKYPWGAMLAHISFPEVDPTGVPATFSKRIISDLLRKELNPDALVITDDIEMTGATFEEDGGKRAVRALQAGADMVMVAWSPKLQRDALHALVRAYQSKELSPSLISASQRRIRLHEGLAPDERQSRDSAVPTLTQLERAEFRQVADSVLSTIRTPAQSQQEIHSNQDTEKVFVLSTRPTTQKKFKLKAQQLLSGEPKVIGLSLNAPSLGKSIERLRKDPNAGVIAFAGGETSAQLLSSLPEDIAHRTTVVHVESRALVDDLGRYFAHVDAHYRHPDLALVIAERFFSTGRLVTENTSTRTETEERSLNARVPASPDQSAEPEEQFP